MMKGRYSATIAHVSFLFFSTITVIVHPTAAPEPSRFHFVLVHGFRSGAWSWYKVRTLLEASGFKVTCLDLKASGIDPSSVDSVHSFDDYTEPLTHFLANYSTTHLHEKVILVGHSAGGLSVTDATYKFSNKIHAAVYVAAAMLKHGFATDQDLIHGMPKNLKARHLHDVPLEDVVLSSMLSRPGPLKAILRARFTGPDDQVDRVPRIYIRTLQDEVLKPKQQEAMITRWLPARVFALDAHHNPLASAPFLLTGLLVKAIEEGL